MKPQKEKQKSVQEQSTVTRRRFRIEKLEERIAPKKGGIPGGCGHGNGPKWKC